MRVRHASTLLFVPLLGIAVLTLFGPTAAAQSTEDATAAGSSAIRQAALDYVEGWKGDWKIVNILWDLRPGVRKGQHSR